MTYLPELRDSLVRAASREYGGAAGAPASAGPPSGTRGRPVWRRGARILPVGLALVVSAAVAVIALTTLKSATKQTHSQSVGAPSTGPAKHAPGVPVSAAVLANIDATLPGASAALTPAGHGYTLDLFIPRKATSALATSIGVRDTTGVSAETKNVIANELAWRVSMLAAYAAAHDPKILGYYAQAPGAGLGTSPKIQPLRSSPGKRFWQENAFDHTPLKEAEQQLQSNLQVVKKAYGQAVPLSTSITAVPLSSTDPNAYALQANITVAHMSDLQPHIGDIDSGLGTGLIGNANALIDGLAVVITDGTGQIGGYWSSPRDGSSSLLYPSSLNPEKHGNTDITFPNLTGGPPTIISVYAGGGTLSGARGQHTPIANGKLHPPPSRTTGNTQPVRDGAMFAGVQVKLSAPTAGTRRSAASSSTMSTRAEAIAAWQQFPAATFGRESTGARLVAGLYDVTSGLPTHPGVQKNVPYPAWVVSTTGPEIALGPAKPPNKKCTDAAIYDLKINAWVTQFQVC